MQNFEKLGVFYLGKAVDPSTQETTDQLILYDSKDLTTHAVCLGMTGSGKTGLAIDILEEAALDKIPAIIIDPKGDMGNLLLTFPNLSPSEFEPWIDPAEAEKQGMSPQAYSESTASTWKKGLKQWGQGTSRIQKLKDSAEMMIYTPASDAGIPISILNSFAAPPKEILVDTGAMRERVMSITSSLLGLVGINIDPIKSREYILISNIIEQNWRAGKNIDLVQLIHHVQNPPMKKMGALDIDTFYPLKDRTALSITLNNLLASPGFQAWMQGVPLDISELLHNKDGKPKLSILSIAHLSDTERMFFVTLLLNQVLGWMRKQPGTSSLRAILYMDEIFGYFPPTAMPPSKIPMLTLLKQARAYGLGVVLTTQNPVDLDYKGLANCGTWFIGKLQTERDRLRVIEGLNIASNGELDAKSLKSLLSTLKKRVFIIRSIYEKEPILFETRWSMSYLRGPLTLTQIESLSEKKSKKIKKTPEKKTISSKFKPTVPSGVNEYFLPTSNEVTIYQPLVLGGAKLHFVNSKNGIDIWKDIYVSAPVDKSGKIIQWEKKENITEAMGRLEREPRKTRGYEDLPAVLQQEKNYSKFAKDFADNLYADQTLEIYRYAPINLTSEIGETEAQFRSRLSVRLRENRDEEIKKLREKYGKKLDAINEKLRQAKARIEQQKTQSGIQKAEAYISFGATILGTIFGKKVSKGTISDASTTMRRIGKMSKEQQDVENAEKNYQLLQQQQAQLEAELTNEIEKTIPNLDPTQIKIDTLIVRPRKSDIKVQEIAILWNPK